MLCPFYGRNNDNKTVPYDSYLKFTFCSHPCCEGYFIFCSHVNNLKLHDVILTDQRGVVLKVTTQYDTEPNRFEIIFIGRGPCMGDSLSPFILSCDNNEVLLGKPEIKLGSQKLGKRPANTVKQMLDTDYTCFVWKLCLDF